MTEGYEKNSAIDIDLNTSIKNLKRLGNKQNNLLNSRHSLIDELSYSICSIGDDVEIIKGKLSEIMNSDFSIYAYKKCESEKSEINLPESLSIEEKIYLCQKIFKRIDKPQKLFATIVGSSNEKLEKDILGKVSYVKNNYTDSAFLKFSKHIESAKYVNCISFETVCDNVYDEKSEYCILPIETSSDGKLFSFYSLIDRYGLKIIQTCDVEYSEGQKYTKFALLKKSIDSTFDMIISPDILDNYFFEMRFSQSSVNCDPIYNIFQAANECNMSVKSVYSIPLPYSDNLTSYYMVFSLKNSSFLEFLTYLAFEFPQCYMVGLYLQIN